MTWEFIKSYVRQWGAMAAFAAAFLALLPRPLENKVFGLSVSVAISVVVHFLQWVVIPSLESRRRRLAKGVQSERSDTNADAERRRGDSTLIG